MILKEIYILVLSLLLFQSCIEKVDEKKNNVPPSGDEVDNFIFVGVIDNKPGLYQYDSGKKTARIFWTNPEESVVELSYSEKRNNTFFLTAKNLENTEAFPFVEGIKLYLINPETGRINPVEEIGSGIQVFTQWEDEINFRITINSFDKTIANYVNHRIIVYNAYGKKLEDKTEIFDLTKQGYPLPPAKKLNLNSPDNLYSIETENNDRYSILLKNNRNKTKKLIIETEQKIKQAEWKNDLLFLSTINSAPENSYVYETSALIIYSPGEEKILKRWKGNGTKNFYTYNNFIVFDDGFENNAGIVIYDYKKMKIYDKIKTVGGCGLRNIPLHFGIESSF